MKTNAFAYPDTSWRASPSFFSMSPCSRPFSSALRVYSSFCCLPLSLPPFLAVSVCRHACLDIFPLISVAIQLNLACLIYLINFFFAFNSATVFLFLSLYLFLLHSLYVLLSFSSSSLSFSLSFCLKKLPAPTWPQSFRDFHLSSSRRHSAPFFAILIVYKWLTLFFIVCRTHRRQSETNRERESGTEWVLLRVIAS